MTSTKADFYRRVLEINTYFDFLRLTDATPSSINYTDPLLGTIANEPVSDDLRKILKANGFLLLYNLVESTVSKSLTAIFNKITDEGLQFADLSDTFRKLWINDRGSDLKGIESLNLNKIRTLMRDVAESILATEIASLSKNCISISGNIDAQEIRKIASQVGFDSIEDGRHLVTIKNKRNQLAHGELSFTDIGKDYSFNELVVFKDDTISFLNLMMQKIELFITGRKYAA